MSRLDLSPLFRSTVGFDHLASMLDAANRVEQPAYPPYNIERVSQDRYRISMAVAGFSPQELMVETENRILKVTGIQQGETEEREYLHRGIAARNFERKFQLADHVEVKGAQIEHGLLHIELEREIPETMKPRKIEIASDSGSLIEEKSSEVA